MADGQDPAWPVNTTGVDKHGSHASRPFDQGNEALRGEITSLVSTKHKGSEESWLVRNLPRMTFGGSSNAAPSKGGTAVAKHFWVFWVVNSQYHNDASCCIVFMWWVESKGRRKRVATTPTKKRRRRNKEFFKMETKEEEKNKTKTLAHSLRWRYDFGRSFGVAIRRRCCLWPWRSSNDTRGCRILGEGRGFGKGWSEVSCRLNEV